MHFKQLGSFFVLWLFESPSIVIMLIIAFATAIGYKLFSVWYVSSESVVFYFLIFTFIITIPTMVALLIEFRNKIPHDRSAIPKFQIKFLVYRIIIAALITGLITIELISFTIEFNLYMRESNEDIQTLESFKFWKEVGSNYSLYVVPPYLFGMACWIKRIKF